MKQKSYSYVCMRHAAACVLALGCLQLTQCKDDDNDGGGIKGDVDSYLKSLPQQVQAAEEEKKASKPTIEATEYETCTTTHYKVGEAYSETVLLDPTTDVVYVGSIIDASTINSGAYRPLYFAHRAPITISTELDKSARDTGAGDVSRYIPEPTLSGYREAKHDMVYSSLKEEGTTAAQMTFDMKEVKSAEEVDIAIGAKVKTSAVKVSSNFNFNTKEKKSHILVRMVQTYYSVDMNLPSRPSDLFTEDVNVEEMKSTMSGTNVAPVYVSSIKYGRRAYFAIESSEDYSKMEQDLNTSISMLTKGVTMSEKTQIEKNLSSMKISGTVIGGSGTDAAKTITGIDGMINFITQGGDYSKNSPGSPMAFTLRKITDNSIFNIVNAGEYNIQSCKENTGLKINLVKCYSQNSSCNLKGWIIVDLLNRFEAYDSPNFYQSGNCSYKVLNRTKDLKVSQGQTRIIEEEEENQSPSMPKIDYTDLPKIKMRIKINNWVDYYDEVIDLNDIRSGEALNNGYYEVDLTTVGTKSDKLKNGITLYFKIDM